MNLASRRGRPSSVFIKRGVGIKLVLELRCVIGIDGKADYRTDVCIPGHWDPCRSSPTGPPFQPTGDAARLV